MSDDKHCQDKLDSGRSAAIQIILGEAREYAVRLADGGMLWRDWRKSETEIEIEFSAGGAPVWMRIKVLWKPPVRYLEASIVSSTEHAAFPIGPDLRLDRMFETMRRAAQEARDSGGG
jgi:hypothetical protein